MTLKSIFDRLSEQKTPLTTNKPPPPPQKCKRMNARMTDLLKLISEKVWISTGKVYQKHRQSQSHIVIWSIADQELNQRWNVSPGDQPRMQSHANGFARLWCDGSGTKPLCHFLNQWLSMFWLQWLWRELSKPPENVLVFVVPAHEVRRFLAALYALRCTHHTPWQKQRILYSESSSLPDRDWKPRVRWPPSTCSFHTFLLMSLWRKMNKYKGLSLSSDLVCHSQFSHEQSHH